MCAGCGPRSESTPGGVDTFDDDQSLTELANHLVELRIERVVVQATSDCRKPVSYLLEAHGLAPWLVNVRDVKHLPGRPKTDVLDAVWLCKVAQRQMLWPSFVPPWPIRRLRDLSRYRVDLVGVRTAKTRVEKLLEDACIKLSVVASDIFGVSGRAMMAALIAGERDPHVLAQMARSGTRTKIGRLEEAFNGRFDSHHRFLLSRMLDRIDGIDADIAAVDEQIEAYLAPSAAAAARLDEILGVGPVAAAVIIAEVRQLPGRAVPAHTQTARQETRDRRCRTLHPGHRMAPSRQRRDTRFTDLGADHFTRHINSDTQKRNHIRQLEALGYTVTLTSAA